MTTRKAAGCPAACPTIVVQCRLGGSVMVGAAASLGCYRADAAPPATPCRPRRQRFSARSGVWHSLTLARLLWWPMSTHIAGFRFAAKLAARDTLGTGL